jgi:hypothetical protein
MLYVRNHVQSLLRIEQKVDLLKRKRQEMLVSMCESVFMKHETYSNQYKKLKNSYLILQAMEYAYASALLYQKSE